jgi:DNA primase
MFPISNEQGDIIAFTGRQLVIDPNSGKYLNSPETALFSKSKILFAFDRARRPIMTQKAVLICEGQLDAVACHEHGIDHTIATQGTACTPQHAKLLKRYTDTALLCFDADKAGYEAAIKAFRELSNESIHIRVVSLPPGDDPDSFLKREGPEAFRELLTQARPFFDYKIDRAQVEGGLANAQARGNTAREVAALLAYINDPVSRDSLLNHCATRLQMSAPDLRAATSTAQKKQLREQRKPQDEATAPSYEPSNIDPTVAYLCNLALHSTEARRFLCEQLETLLEASRFLEGIPLLESILSSDCDATNPAAINTFLASLPVPDQLALQRDPTFHQEVNTLLQNAAADALSKLSEKALNQRYAANQSALNQPGLSAEKLLPLLKEAEEINNLLASLGHRTVADDRASLGETGKKTPTKKVWKKDWKPRDG